MGNETATWDSGGGDLYPRGGRIFRTCSDTPGLMCFRGGVVYDEGVLTRMRLYLYPRDLRKGFSKYLTRLSRIWSVGRSHDGIVDAN